MTFTIRDFVPEDSPAIHRVHDRARLDELHGSFDERAFVPLADDPEGDYLHACDVCVAVDDVDGDVVGFVGIDDPYVAWLYVDPVHYRRGIGRALLRHGLQRLGGDAWTLTCGNNQAAMELYLAEGFVVETRFVGRNNGYEGPVVRLALDPAKEGWTRARKSAT